MTFSSDDDARIYATARADAMDAALASGSADQVMAVYRQICDDGHPDAADALIKQIVAAAAQGDDIDDEADGPEW